MKGTNYTSIGYNFLQLTINSIQELEKQGNNRAVAMNGEMNEAEFWEEFEKRTKWNDQNIAIPVLFNFFHGVELILKGLIIYCGGDLKKKTHNLTNLLSSLKKTPNTPSQRLILHFEKILSDNGLEDFFISNNTNVDSFYDLFKYPESNKGDEIKFYTIRGHKESGLTRFAQIKDLAIGIKEEIKTWLSEDK